MCSRFSSRQISLAPWHLKNRCPQSSSILKLIGQIVSFFILLLAMFLRTARLLCAKRRINILLYLGVAASIFFSSHGGLLLGFPFVYVPLLGGIGKVKCYPTTGRAGARPLASPASAFLRVAAQHFTYRTGSHFWPMCLRA